MASALVRIGLLVVAAALVGLLLSHSAYQGEAPYQAWVGTGLALGPLMIVAGVVLGLAGRMGRRALPTRCARCESPVERGQVYCADHLKLTVDEARDELHGRNLDRGVPRG